MRRKKTTTRKSTRAATRNSTTTRRRTRRRNHQDKSRVTSAATAKSSQRTVCRPSSRITRYIDDSQKLLLSQTELNEINYGPKKRGTSKCSLFDHKDFFPQELRNYIDILNELFDRQNDIIFSGPHARIDNLREAITIPPEVEGLTLPPRQNIEEKPSLALIRAAKFNAKLEDDKTLRYLTASSSRRRTAEKDYVVAAMTAKGSVKGSVRGSAKVSAKGSTKKSARKTGSVRRSAKGSVKSKRGTAAKGSEKDAKKGTAQGDVTQIPILNYQLSDLENLKNGMTAVPNETLIGTIISFKAEPPNPFIHAFRDRVDDEVYHYGPNHVAATFKPNGTGLVSYPNGETAIQITDGRIGKRLVVYSQSGENENGVFHGNVPMAIFDNYGNGAVFDIDGNIRLNYDQGEGVLYDTRAKVPVYWRWSNSQFLIQRKKSLEFAPEDSPDNDVPDTPIVYDVLVEEETHTKKKSKLARGTARRTAKSKAGKSVLNESRKTGRGKSAKESRLGSKKGKSTKKEEDAPQTSKDDKQFDAGSFGANKWNHKGLQDPKGPPLDTERSPSGSKKYNFPPITDMKPMVLKITKNISLKILTQEHIHIDFLYPPVHFSLYIGTRIYPAVLDRIDKIVRTPGEQYKVPCYFEFLHKRTYSLHDLYAKRLEMKAIARRERIKKQIKFAYIMGTYKKKVMPMQEPIITQASN